MKGWHPLETLRFAEIFVAIALSFSAGATVNVPEHHNHASRDGLYVDAAFTMNAATNLKIDPNFNGFLYGNIANHVYAQPLYIEGRADGRAMVITVTESNNVYALDAADGTILWQDHLGAPVSLSSLPCGDIDPLGITGTPVVDLVSRALFLDAMTTTNGGATVRHLIWSLNVDTGATNSGWPVDVDASAQFDGVHFTSLSQNQRGALALSGGYVYVPYGGHAGDCSTYYGWVVGVQENNPTNVVAWATSARGGGIWAVGGVAADGTNLFAATGNTFNAATWSGGEAIIHFEPGPVFSSSTNDYWAPTNWISLDNSDTDLGGSGALILDVPGASPSNLVVSLGKDGNAYLLNRTNLGGVSAPLAQRQISPSAIRQAAAAYQTASGTYVVCSSDSTALLIAFRITPTSPPTITGVWTNSQNGRGSPFVTSADGTNRAIVWCVGAEGDNHLRGFDGDTGALLFDSGVGYVGFRRFNTGIAARGRIYLATDNQVRAFTVPIPPIVLTNAAVLPGSTFQCGFTNTPGLSFTVYDTTNLAVPFSNWTRLGSATEIAPGRFQFSDSTTSNQQRFYRVASP